MATIGAGDYQYEVVEGWGMIPQLGLVFWCGMRLK